MAEHSGLHESPDDLSTETRDMHRALVSLMEELEAVDWYGQRIEACDDDELAAVLGHNRDEKKEHACMTLEWIRRRDLIFDRFLREFLFRSDSITAHEDAKDTEPTLGIGSLRRTDEENA